MAQAQLTDAQLTEAVEAYAAHGTKTKAADVLGVNRMTFYHRIEEAIADDPDNLDRRS